MRQFSIFALSAAVALGTASTAHASSISFELTCVLNATVTCGVPSYGTVTFDDSPGDGDIRLTIDLAGTGEKFKDLYFNYGGSATGITADTGTNLLLPNTLDGSPYDGLFDVGPLGSTGDPKSFILYGWNNTSATSANSSTTGIANVALAPADFKFLDSGGQTYLMLHIQGIGGPADCEAGGTLCTPGTTGNRSMNSVGSNGLFECEEADDCGPGTHITAEAPEPASLLLFGSGLIAAAMRGRRKARR